MRGNMNQFTLIEAMKALVQRTSLLTGLVANFKFLEWTDSNHVRRIKFVGLRSDKDPLCVVRE